jgi:hypothetical protein
VKSSLADFKALSLRISGLSLFSPNEILDDISTRNLAYLLVPYAFAEIQGRLKTIEHKDRIESLGQAQVSL